MGIKRDEERSSGRRQNQEKEKEEDPRWEDTTVVSVTALVAFLESLVSDQGSQNPVMTPPSAASVGAPQPQAAAAARAYRTTAGAKSPPQAAPPSGSKPVLTPEESATIVRLLDDLKFLADRKVENLIILRSDSFLQSLVDAAARARHGL